MSLRRILQTNEKLHRYALCAQGAQAPQSTAEASPKKSCTTDELLKHSAHVFMR
jgi:hypothetical protein